MTGLVALAASLTTAVGLVAAPAGASPSTKWFTDTVGSSSTSSAPTVVLPASSTTQTVYLRVNNATDSNQSFGSADVDLLKPWSWANPHVTTSTGSDAHWTATFDAA
ncbi:MAG TPA: hypothetical protein VKJ07_18605, partial [Mycobacteriales bacterium]|nr:hypothetical protein [Mycobacteriales bacterium]